MNKRKTIYSALLLMALPVSSTVAMNNIMGSSVSVTATATSASSSSTLSLDKSSLVASDANHFITDATYRKKVDETFNSRISFIGKQFFNTKGLKATAQEREALQFLYAYMPLADVTDYTTAFFLQNVRSSFAVRNEMAWGAKVPELLFRHFVLPIRINNENLDNSRMEFYKELRDRVKGKNMYDAILEVNHWCHEKVSYQPSDGRTSAPLATVRSAYGRCGEQSTFTVAALRAVGIPARQVYTPRWAHTDDNHAWVEAWADGTWYFLGACEPEAVLNLGWFNAPASRALLMHTKAFGDYNGPEEVMLRTSNYTEINLIGNYGETARADFHIVDAAGKPVEGARVDFKIYNYAEYCTVVTKYTGADGSTFLSAGKGDMMVWASKNGKYGFGKVSFGKDRALTVRLDHDATQACAQRDTFDIVPPVGKPNLPEVTPAQKAANDVRLAYEDSIRHAYLATFYTPETARKACEANGLPADEVAPLLVASSGNHAVILQFLLKNKARLDRAIALLKTLRAKDLRDMPMDILDDNMLAESAQLCPRVEDEMIIHPFKHFFQKAFSKAEADRFRQNPDALAEWVEKNVRLNPDTKALAIAQTPVGVWQSRLTDNRSRKIFFVDVARSLGIEARVDAVTKKTQYRKDGQWVDVLFGQKAQMAATGTLKITYTDNGVIDNPKYYSHFSLARVNADGTTSLLEYDDSGEVTWANTFRDGVSLDAGQYILVTGTRLADGGVMSAMQMFNVEAGKTTTLPMLLRTSTTAVTVIGNFDSESTFQKMDGSTVNILSQTGRGYFITGLIGVGQEPTNHALKDIAKVASAFDKWNRPLLLLFEDEAAAAKFKPAEFEGLPKNIIFGIDKGGAIRKQIAANMNLSHPNLSPIFFISDTFNRVVYLSQGYTIGLGEQMELVIKKL